MSVRSVAATKLQQGDVLALPFNKTATIWINPRSGGRYVSFRTEHGPTRLGIHDDVLIEQADVGAQTDDGRGMCFACRENLPEGECPDSKRPCGHHSNESWDQDQCFWCGEAWGS